MDATTLRPLLALMRKRHLSLGGLTVEQQALVWALVWAGPPDGAMSERQVNEELKGQLAVPPVLSTPIMWNCAAGWWTLGGCGATAMAVNTAARRRPNCPPA